MTINQFVEKLISQMTNLDVRYDSQPFEPSPTFEQFGNAPSNITHRKPLRKSALYSQKAAKRIFKIKKSFAVSQLLNLRSDVSHDDKLDYILKKIKHQND